MVLFLPQVLSRGCHSLQQGGASLLCSLPDRRVLDALRWASERQLDLIEQTPGAAASVLAGVCAFSWKMTRTTSRAESEYLSSSDFIPAQAEAAPRLPQLTDELYPVPVLMETYLQRKILLQKETSWLGRLKKKHHHKAFKCSSFRFPVTLTLLMSSWWYI